MRQRHAVQQPRKKPKEVRREELMDAAQILFLKQGYAATSVDEIVQAADVAKGTFYVYFPSKDHVVASLQERYIANFRHQVGGAVEAAAQHGFRRQISAWVAAAVGAYLDQAQLHDLLFYEVAPLKREGKQDNPVVSDLAILLEQGNRARTWHVADFRLTAAMLFSALHGAVDDTLVNSSKADRAKLIAHIQRFFDDALPN